MTVLPTRSLRVALLGIAAVLSAAGWGLGLESPVARAQEVAGITGVLTNGTPGAAFAPEQAPVTLRMLEGVVTLEPQTVSPQPDGSFSFPGVEAVEGRVYFLSVEYQGAVYSATPDPTELSEPVALTVYEATTSTEVLTIGSYTIIVTGADVSQRLVEVLEQADVINESNVILVPDLTAPGAMGFMRFALPAGSFNLDVRSNLVGGQVLEVDRGFAITTPVPPSHGQPHQMEFIYRVPYEGTTVDLDRSLPFGAGTLRVLVPTSVGNAISPGLADLGNTTIGGREFHFLEGVGIAPDTRLELRLDGLPQPSLWSRVGRHAGRWYLVAGVPSGMGAALMAVLAYALLRRWAARRSPARDRGVERQRLLDEAAGIQVRYGEGKLSPRRYRAERDQLKHAVMELDLEAQMEELTRPVDRPSPP